MGSGAVDRKSEDHRVESPGKRVSSEMVQEPSEAPWRWLREPRRARILWASALSLAVHLVLTPAAALLGVFAWLASNPPDDDGHVEQLRAIPITFLGYEELPAPPAAEEPAAAPSAALLPPPGTAPAAAAPAEAKPEMKPTAGKEEEAPPKPEPAREAPATPSPRAGVAHPVAMSGVASEVVDDNANVNLLLLTERVRHHPLGARVGKLLVNFPQWSSFFASADVDPVRDLNRMLIVGPQFRKSADVVAILHHQLPQKVLKGAVDRLVQRPPRGRWLQGKLPAALAHADRAERLFAFTAPNVLVVAPPHLERSLMASPPTKFPTPPGDEAVVLHIKTPWRALMGLPFRLPESIAWLRLDVLPLENGGADLRLVAEDESAELASEHAASLSTALNALTNPDLGALGALVGMPSIAFIDRVQFKAHDKRISAEVRVTPRQLDRLLTYAEELVVQWTGRRYADPAPQRTPSSVREPPSPPQRPSDAKTPPRRSSAP